MATRLATAVTTAAAVLAGSALWVVSARAVWVGTTWLTNGNLRAALGVFVIAAATFPAALVFLCPVWLNRLLQAGASPRFKGFIAFLTTTVLVVIVLSAAIAERLAGNLIFGIFPRAALWPVTIAFGVLFTLAFIVPGLAYRTYRNGPAGQSPPPETHEAPRLAWGIDYIEPTGLRRLIGATAIIYAALVLLAFYAWAFAKVLPDASILEFNRRYLPLTILLPILPFAVALWRAPITGTQDGWIEHLRAKLPVVLGFLMFNGLIAVNLPERGLPLLANLVLDSQSVRREVTVVKAEPRSGTRGCQPRVVILLNPATGRLYDVCGLSREFVERLEPGDPLVLHGRSAGYGVVLTGASVRKPAAGD